MRLSREKFLHTLEMVQPGISPKGVLLQSDCFCFVDGLVWTFNEEVACRTKSGLDKDFRGAVKHERFLSTLQKVPDDDLELSVDGDEVGSLLVLRGRGKRRARFRMEADISLPVEAVEQPDRWKPLGEDFAEAISTVQHCTGRDEGGHYFYRATIHIHPQWVEACDGSQLCRWGSKARPLQTGVETPSLLRHESIKHVISLGMTEVSETSTWLHYRNPSSLIMSCRRYDEQFPELDGFMTPGGEPLVLAKGLEPIVELAGEFSAENGPSHAVQIDIKPNGSLTVTGVGNSGDYVDGGKIKYQGPKLSFLIAPKILAGVIAKHSECFVTENRLRVQSSSYVYYSCLNAPSNQQAEELDSGDQTAQEPPESAPARPVRRREAVAAVANVGETNTTPARRRRD